MNEKDKLKAKLELLFAAALMEIPDAPGPPAKAPESTGLASSPSQTRPPLGSHGGAIPQYNNAQSAPSPSFHGIVT